MPRGHRFLPTPYAGGASPFLSDPKRRQKLAGNAIPRFRLPSERKIAHARISNFYPYFDTSVRNRKCFLNLRFVGYAILQNRRLSRPSRFAASGGGRKAEGGKHFNCRVNCMSAADRRLLMPAGHLLFCATKKVAGNAIPRSRLPSEREIAHARVSNLCTYFGYKVRHRKKYFFKPTVIFHSGRAPGRPRVITARLECPAAPGLPWGGVRPAR